MDKFRRVVSDRSAVHPGASPPSFADASGLARSRSSDPPSGAAPAADLSRPSSEAPAWGVHPSEQRPLRNPGSYRSLLRGARLAVSPCDLLHSRVQLVMILCIPGKLTSGAESGARSGERHGACSTRAVTQHGQRDLPRRRDVQASRTRSRHVGSRDWIVEEVSYGVESI